MAIILFLNTWLATRLYFTFRDQPLSRKQGLVLGLIQVLLTGVLKPGYPTLWLAAAVIASLMASEVLTTREHLNEARLAGVCIVFTTALVIHWQYDTSSWLLADQLHKTWRPFLFGLLGFLLIANEANLAIRALLHCFHLEPLTTRTGSARTLDDREYNAGRVIGMLERGLIYLVLVVAQNYNVIALILAAKGFARFRQMDEREFAEYVLIGTLASLLLTTLVAQMILHFL